MSRMSGRYRIGIEGSSFNSVVSPKQVISIKFLIYQIFQPVRIAIFCPLSNEPPNA